jgi:hypothetical protein
MTFKVLDTKIVWGPTFPAVMNAVVAMEKDGWKPLGTPAPLVLGESYGMMHMIYRDRSKE